MANPHGDLTITSPHHFRLADHDPAAKPPVAKGEAQRRTRIAAQAIGDRQERMMAVDTWSLLAVFQGMDTSGKDGTIARVFAGVNPSGVTVTSFKAPSSAERAQDFLWRIHASCPSSGHIGVFNRSHYEDVLVPRIHPEELHTHHIPDELRGEDFWRRRLDDIVQFERMLDRQGTIVLKFFLNISRKEQRKRLLDRLDQPDKTWKFSPTDLTERTHWDAYLEAYNETIAATATTYAPWHVIPANHKWYARMAVAEIVSARLREIDLSRPKPNPALKTALDTARAALKAE
jgi:PPK2 family polyphosphate:nucleotide phosphotransferase